MSRSELVRGAVLPGACAGLIGGLVFGAALADLGIPPLVARLGANSPLVGFVGDLVIAGLAGAGFGVLLWRQRPGPGETFFWGLAYGVLWWFIEPLTLVPLALGHAITWDVHTAQAAFPALLGYVLYGATLGLALHALSPRRRAGAGPATAGALVRGGLAGLVGAWVLGLVLDAQGQLAALAPMMTGRGHAAAWAATLLIGVIAGAGFAALYPIPIDGAGASLIRGTVYGFFWWVFGALTLAPLLEGAGLAWSVEAARTGFATLPGYLLFGAGAALLYHWLDALVRLLFADRPIDHGDEGAGARGLRALGRGVLAGLVGGALFTGVMLQVGFLTTVASLVGSSSPWTGLLVHLVISFLIGASYGVLFRRQSHDLGSALGWGVSYGFFWWVLGPLTLMEILFGVAPQWTVSVAAGFFASLIGHLAYGAGLGVTYYLLEARYSPWWIPRSQADASRAARRY
jgi:hypothetical protein